MIISKLVSMLRQLVDAQANSSTYPHTQLWLNEAIFWCVEPCNSQPQCVHSITVVTVFSLLGRAVVCCVNSPS